MSKTTGISKLAEMVILQAMEDLYSIRHSPESIEYFQGEGFSTWAKLAGIEGQSKCRLTILASQALSKRTKKAAKKKPVKQHEIALVH